MLTLVLFMKNSSRSLFHHTVTSDTFSALCQNIEGVLKRKTYKAV